MKTLVLSGKNSTIVALLAALLVTGLILATGMCIYESNDDMVMIGLLAGKQGMVASPDAIFLSLPLSILLHKLYGINGTLPWYGLLMYCLLVISCTIGLRIIIDSRAPLANRAIAAVAFLGFYSYLVCRLNFASVSLLLGFTAIAAVAQANMERRPVARTDILYGSLLGLSYLIRPDIFFISVVFSLPAIASCIVFPNRKRLAALLVPLILALLLANGAALVLRASEEYRAYAKFNRTRAYFTDSALSEPNAKTIHALIQTGWSRSDYFLAHNWWFHDAALFNLDTFTTFITNNKQNAIAAASLTYSRDAFTEHRRSLAVVLLALAPCICELRRRRERPLIGSRLLASSLVATLAGFVLLTAIRLPPRVALPLFTYFVLLGVTFLPYWRGAKTENSLRTIFVPFLCGAAILFFAGMDLHTLTKRGETAKRIKDYTDSTLLQVQKARGTDTYFLSANARCAAFYPEAANTLREYADMVQILNFPMGWTIASPAYNAFLRSNGFGDRFSVVQRMINHPRLVLAFWESPDERFELFAEQLQIHLRDHYASRFPGMTVSVVPFLDKRKVIGDFGWVFFTLRATPHDATMTRS